MPGCEESIISEHQAGYISVIVGGQSLRVTPSHPFDVKVKGWTDAADLLPGDLLRTVGGTWSAVQGIYSEPDIRHWPHLGFATGTPILTADWSTPIEDLRSGDLIDSSPDEPDADLDDELPPWHWN